MYRNITSRSKIKPITLVADGVIFSPRDLPMTDVDGLGQLHFQHNAENSYTLTHRTWFLAGYSHSSMKQKAGSIEECEELG